MSTHEKAIMPIVEIAPTTPNCPELPEVVETIIHALQLPASQFPADKVVKLTLQFTTALSSAELEVSRR